MQLLGKSVLRSVKIAGVASVALVAFIAGGVYVATPEQTQLKILTWDGVGAAMTLVGAVATFAASGIALWLADQGRREALDRRRDSSRVFSVLVRVEVSTVQARTIGLRRLLATMHRSGRGVTVANWPIVVDTIKMLSMPITEKLIERALDIDPVVTKPIIDTMAMTEQLKTLISGWEDARTRDDQNLQSSVSALRVLTIGLQLQVNSAHDQAWSLSRPQIAAPELDGRNIEAEERALYEGYLHQNGIDVSRLFPVRGAAQ